MSSESKKIVNYLCRRGMIAHFASDNSIGEALHRYGEWGEDEIILLSKYLPTGGVAVDIGANVGTHTLAFAQQVGEGGLVIAVEGQNEIHQILSYNVVQNGASNIVRCINGLASDRVGTTQQPIEKNRNLENYGAVHFRDATNAVLQTSSDATANTILPILSIDALSLLQCHLIKIDAEGMEREIIFGSSETLDRCSPTIYFEQTEEFSLNNPSIFRDIFDFLTIKKYYLYWHIANPFNASNFKGNEFNIFGGNVEVNVLACPSSFEAPTGLTRISTSVYAPPIPNRDLAVSGVTLPLQVCEARKDASSPASPVSNEFNQLKAAFDALLKDRKAAQEVIEHQSREIARFRDTAAKDRDSTEQLAVKVATLSAEIDAILKSRSWRLTSPLRKALRRKN